MALSEPAAGPAALIARAQALEGAGQLAAAETAWRRALAVLPGHPDVLRQLGVLNHRLGRAPAARRYLEQSIDAAPRAEVCLLLAGVCLAAGDTAAAEAACRKATELAPADAAAWLELASVLLARRRFAEAEAALRACIARDPDDYAARRNLGPTLYAQNQVEDALAVQRDTVRRHPDDPMSWLNLATIQHALAAFAEAETSRRTAIRLAPDLAEAHRDLGLSLLLRGADAEGYAEYEWRHRTAIRGADPLSGTRWTGAPMRGALLLHVEQGMGDTIQMLRFIPAAQARVGRLVVCLPPPLVRLAAASFPGLEIVALGTKLPRTDAYCYMLGLPQLLAASRDLHAPDAASPTLRAPAAIAARWRALYPAQPGRRRIGLVWAGNPTHENDHNRSLDPDMLRPLTALPDIDWIALQPGAALPPGVVAPAAALRDFAETAGLVAQLDVVISVDTAAAHLAGALGRPVWALLAAVPDWRWGLASETTALYPTMRLFRQARRGDWASVIAQVCHHAGLRRSG